MATNTNSNDPPTFGSATNQAMSIPPAITVTWLDNRNFRIHIDSKSVDFSQYNTNAAHGTIFGDQQTQARSVLDSLTDTDWLNLRTLKALKATDRETATTREAVAAAVGNGNHDSNHNERSFAHLKEFILIESMRNVGTWINSKGLALIAEKDRQ
jgi:hypothetical protein